MEDCMRHISENPETPDDEVLVATARALKIFEDVLTARPSRRPDSETWQLPNPPPMLVIKALRGNLEDLRRTTSRETLQNSTVTQPCPFLFPPDTT